MSKENEFTPTHRARPYAVNARMIGAVIGNNTGGGVLLQLADGSTYPADNAMTARHFPKAGDYLLIGEDGFPYLNTPELFERKYSPIESGDEALDVPMDFEPRFTEHDAVLFQPNIGMSTGAAFALVTRAYPDGSTVRYDLEVRHNDGKVETWHPVRGVDSMMVLALNEAAAAPATIAGDHAATDVIQLRISSLHFAASMCDGSDGILSFLQAARQVETYIGTGVVANSAGTLAQKPEPAAASARLDDLVPNDGPRITPDLVEEGLDEEYYFTGRQVALALGMKDDTELERLTICILRLRSGALAVGTAIVVSLENFDQNKARQQAYRAAMQQLTDNLGFQMKQRLYEEEQRNQGIVQP